MAALTKHIFYSDQPETGYLDISNLF